MKISFCISLGLLTLLAFFGCGGSSELEMKAAEHARDQALSAHADLLSPSQFQEAQKTLEHAQAAAKEGKTSSAKVLFASAKIYFSKSALIAKTNREALTKQLDGLSVAINVNLGQVNSDLAKKKLSFRDQEQVKAIVAQIVKDKASMQDLSVQDDLIKAVATAKEVQMEIYKAQLILAGEKPHRNKSVTSSEP
jgi:hypothetical protein